MDISLLILNSPLPIDLLIYMATRSFSIQHPNYFRQIGPVFSLSFRRAQILFSNWTKLLSIYEMTATVSFYPKL